MGAILIKTNKENSDLLTELAKRLGSEVINVEEEQFEDFALGNMMDAIKTGEVVSRESVMAKLRSK